MQIFFDKYGHIITWLGIVSTITFFLSLLIIPWIVCKLDDHFFLHLHEHKKMEDQHPVMFILLRILRYSFGAILLLAGILMLFLPGQGLLTIILGISLLDFPGKQKAIDGLLHFHPVQNGLNWVREKGSKKPFLFTDSE
ncbi:MAG: PGPGW domain-containing protein, partial [Thermodesulfobacteriota bacterium]|nr:PGPGW domain-containing protein [Thermodesulfobacteriota bacterium]